ncbi:MAG: caspase domain-containing protein, partial [Candidatus Sericytochromatia bacterium]
ALKTHGLERELDIELGNGRNRIQVSCMNAKGVESLRETAELSYTGPAALAKLHVIALGVSDYQDPRYHLNYAAKDAGDLAAFFRPLAASVTLLQNAAVTREKVLALKQQLLKTNVDDRVIVFLAGHGLLDDQNDYYFGTADLDFEHPQTRGLPIDAIEDLLDGIPARNKLLLMDTCHAGEVDKDLPVEHFAVTSGQVQARSLRGIRVKGQLGPDEIEKLLAETFVNLRQGSGSQMITASAGLEFAFEAPDWHNGVFTYTLLMGLKEKAADQNADGLIRVSELQHYVAQTVPALTQNRQHPAIRAENLVQDMRVN